MFVIKSNWQYILHFVGEEEVAVAVINDLKNRDSCVDPQSIFSEDCEEGLWDPGGSLMLGDKHHTFDLGKTKMVVAEQHLFSLMARLETSGAQEARELNGVKYHKIHSGYLCCFCLSEREFKKLKCDVRVSALTIEAQNTLERKNKSLEEAGILTLEKLKNEIQ